MEENAALSAKSLIEQENRQYNETNALYHAAAVQFGLSDTAFWILYALYSSAAPLTQVQMCAEWCLPKQTLDSAVRSMVEQGLLVLTPAPGGKRAKNLNLTEAGRALAEKNHSAGCPGGGGSHMPHGAGAHGNRPCHPAGIPAEIAGRIYTVKRKNRWT